jgi:hypothetical protein
MNQNKNNRLCRLSPNAPGQVIEKPQPVPTDVGVLSREDLSREVRQLARNVEIILRELAPLRTLEELKTCLEETTEKILSIANENKILNEKLVSQTKTIDMLNNKIKDLEQYSRGDCAEILGIEERQGECCEDLIVGLAKASGVRLELSDISSAHRVPNASGEKRKLLVRFVRRGTRNRMFGAVRACRTSVTKLNEELEKMNIPQLEVSVNRQNIFINECLTKVNRGIFLKALAIKKKLNLYRAWTTNGLTKIQIASGEPVKIFHSEEELDGFVTEFNARNVV